MIVTTLGALVTAEPALARLADLWLPASAARHLARVVKGVRRETAFFNSELAKARKELGDERPATPEEQEGRGWQIVTTVKPEHMTAFLSRVEELNAMPITIDSEPIALDELIVIRLCEHCGKSLTKPFTTSAADLLALEPLLGPESPTEKKE